MALIEPATETAPVAMKARMPPVVPFQGAGVRTPVAVTVTVVYWGITTAWAWLLCAAVGEVAVGERVLEAQDPAARRRW